jgi:hypothetical protein
MNTTITNRPTHGLGLNHILTTARRRLAAAIFFSAVMVILAQPTPADAKPVPPSTPPGAVASQPTQPGGNRN